MATTGLTFAGVTSGISGSLDWMPRKVHKIPILPSGRTSLPTRTKSRRTGANEGCCRPPQPPSRANAHYRRTGGRSVVRRRGWKTRKRSPFQDQPLPPGPRPARAAAMIERTGAWYRLRTRMWSKFAPPVARSRGGVVGPRRPFRVPQRKECSRPVSFPPPTRPLRTVSPSADRP